MRQLWKVGLVCIAGGSLAVAGCAGSGSGGGEQARAEVRAVNGSAEIGYEAWKRLGYRLEWKSQPILQGNSRVRFFDVFDGEVVVHDTGNIISVMEKTTGAVRWSDKLGESIVRYVGNVKLDESRILASSETEARILDARTGELLDRQRLAVLANTKPKVVGNIAVYGCTTGEVLGHNLVSGYKQWGHLLDQTIEADIAENGPNVAAVSGTGRVAVLEARRGGLIAATKMYDGAGASGAMTSGMVVYPSLDQSLWAFDTLTGKDLWRVRTQTPLSEKPVAHDRTVYVSLPDRGFSAVSMRSGEVEWSTPGVRGEVVAVRGERLIVWDGSGLTSLDIDDGAVVERVDLPGASKVEADGFIDGDLYIAWTRGPVLKLSPR